MSTYNIFVPNMSFLQLKRKFWLLKVTVCFHSISRTSFISKDQGEFDSLWYEPFNNGYVTEEPAVILIWFESKVLLEITAVTSHHVRSAHVSSRPWSTKVRETDSHVFPELLYQPIQKYNRRPKDGVELLICTANHFYGCLIISFYSSL